MTVARNPRRHGGAATGLLLVPALLLALAGCSSSGSAGKKMADLPKIQAAAEVRQLWKARIGKSDGHALQPAVVGSAVFAAAADGDVARYEDGKEVWRAELKHALSGGVAADERLVVVGTPKGEVIALSAADGRPLWKARVTSDILAPAAIGDGLVVVRSGDHRLFAFDVQDGNRRWVYQRTTPPLAVRATAAPVIADRLVFAGFPGGKLVAVATGNGAVAWEGNVAQPKGSTELERIADVVAAPVLGAREVCAVAFQGRLACFDLSTGNSTWTRDVSSSVGVAIDADHVYVTDDQGVVQAFDRVSGSSVWKQDKLLNRMVSGPLVRRGMIAVTDTKGLVHFLKRGDGEFAARAETDGTPIAGVPVAFAGGVLVQTRDGALHAIEAD